MAGMRKHHGKVDKVTRASSTINSVANGSNKPIGFSIYRVEREIRKRSGHLREVSYVTG